MKTIISIVNETYVLYTDVDNEYSSERMYRYTMEVDMRRYSEDNNNNVVEVKCNMCGRSIKLKNGLIVEGNMSIDYPWGYFSDKDGEIHKFDICQKCYDRIVESFVIPVDVEENKELL